MLFGMLFSVVRFTLLSIIRQGYYKDISLHYKDIILSYFLNGKIYSLVYYLPDKDIIRAPGEQSN